MLRCLGANVTAVHHDVFSARADLSRYHLFDVFSPAVGSLPGGIFDAC